MTLYQRLVRLLSGHLRDQLRLRAPKGFTPGVRRVAEALLLGILVSVGVTAASRLGALAGWETRALDLFLFFRDRVPTPEIALVVIDDASFEALGARQPLPRTYLAELAEFVLQSGARAVAFDVVLKSPTVAAEDAALIETTKRWQTSAGRDRIVFADFAEPKSEGRHPVYAMPGPFSRDVRAIFGFANAPVGDDGVIRRSVPVLPAADGGHLPSLALAALAAAEGYRAEDLMRELRAGGQLSLPARDRTGHMAASEAVAVPTLAGNQWRIDFAGPAGSFAAFPSEPILALARSGVKAPADNPFNGKIVFVGATFKDSRDYYPTPVGTMAGVEIQANIAHTLLSRRALLPPGWLLNITVLVGTCVTVSLLSLYLRPLWVTVAAFGLVGVFAVVSYEAYTEGGYWLDFVGPLMGMKTYLSISGWLARRRLSAAFGEYVSPEVMERVVMEGARLGGEVRTVSVLMSDLRGFTTMAERLRPDEITTVMNEYLTAMVEVILAHRGMVSDFIGDGILAFFGAPSDDSEHAAHAVQTALGMQAALEVLNPAWQKAGRPTLSMGIAVNTGSVYAGNVGSPKKKKYAVMGDPVNTVSRMEGQNRELGTAILIGRATLDAVKGRVVVRERGAVKVKGKEEPVELFELLGWAEESVEEGRR
ncbi:MAG: adenylate/guanylate cyclase domain-containing protein [Candidatus Rokubacteria bacterium]|nr:adenylate/guanylate cyclase domain-containing protein [Candidatus Rokubacteria bacterium]